MFGELDLEIRELLEQGHSVESVIRTTGASPRLVYDIYEELNGPIDYDYVDEVF